MEFYYIIHYVVYRFYRRHKESFESSLSYACLIHSILFFFLIGDIDYFLCLFLDMQLHINKTICYVYLILWAIFEYIVFYRNRRYIEIFSEYNRLSDTPEMKLKLKKAKIFNYSVFIVDLLLLIVVDYCNHHK